MISPELIRRYPFFAGLDAEHLVVLAKSGSELSVGEGHYFFRAEEVMDFLYLVLEGEIAIGIELPEQDREIVSNTVEEGDIFGWTALVPPYNSTASARTVTPCRVVVFDCRELRPILEEDCRFGHEMMKKVAQVIRDQLYSLRIETLACKYD